MIDTFRLHLLLVSNDDANFFEGFAEARGVGLGVLCRQLIELKYEWVERLFSDQGFSTYDLKHDFVGLLKQDEHFLPRI
jgi:hypothetical protein